MKITNVTCFRANGVFVKIETDEGITGYGEGSSFTPLAVIGMVEELKPYILGDGPAADRIFVAGLLPPAVCAGRPGDRLGDCRDRHGAVGY
ncbi:hypothetical protein ACHHV8_22790 [Paenibacillus sp. TAB 01]|uniref:hypothetical protein n=1 Tax=Paenibacillus sp. TAB 01 TaxID=3368988 RepID=UPI0037500457